MRAQDLKAYVIYDSPADAPGFYVLRVWNMTTGQPSPHSIKSTDIERVRGHIPAEAVKIGRYGGDDPVIKEVWLN